MLSFLRPFVAGSTIVLLDAWDATLAAEMIEEHGVESTAGTPYFVTSLFEAADAQGRDLSSLHRFMVGAANVPGAIIEVADERGITAYRAYGSTEHPTVIRGGENISSKEVEDLLMEHWGIKDAAAVAAPDPRLGEVVGAFVVLRPGAALDLADVGRWFRAAGLAVQKNARAVGDSSPNCREARGQGAEGGSAAPLGSR